MAETQTEPDAIEWDQRRGHIRVLFEDGARYDLRPPSFDEMEQLESLIEKATAETQAAQDAAGDAYVAPKPMEQWKENLTWWRLAFELLSSPPLAEGESPPIWLGNGTLIFKARRHWIEFPTQALGSELLTLLGAQAQATTNGTTTT